jgi:hypothetical protein
MLAMAEDLHFLYISYLAILLIMLGYGWYRKQRRLKACSGYGATGLTVAFLLCLVAGRTIERTLWSLNGKLQTSVKLNSTFGLILDTQCDSCQWFLLLGGMVAGMVIGWYRTKKPA